MGNLEPGNAQLHRRADRSNMPLPARPGGQSSLTQVDFTGADLTGPISAEFATSRAGGANLSKARLEGAKLQHAP
jgi:uncharacterized protein YjbI with pentapeptide repeats